jgi:hypothetical protein
MALRRRLVVRGCVLAAVTTSIGLWAASEGPPAGTASERRVAHDAGSRPHPATPSDGLRLQLTARTLPPQPAQGLFESRSWKPPAPPPPAPRAPHPPPPPPAPDPPAAPPLPFTFLGAFESAGGKPVFYLVEGERVHAVSAGETLNELYSIEAVDAERMVLLYLPLKIRQTLAFEGKK